MLHDWNCICTADKLHFSRSDSIVFFRLPAILFCWRYRPVHQEHQLCSLPLLDVCMSQKLDWKWGTYGNSPKQRKTKSLTASVVEAFFSKGHSFVLVSQDSHHSPSFFNLCKMFIYCVQWRQSLWLKHFFFFKYSCPNTTCSQNKFVLGTNLYLMTPKPNSLFICASQQVPVVWWALWWSHQIGSDCHPDPEPWFLLPASCLLQPGQETTGTAALSGDHTAATVTAWLSGSYSVLSHHDFGNLKGLYLIQTATLQARVKSQPVWEGRDTRYCCCYC